MRIFYEDRYLIVAYKEPGVSSQKDPSGRPDMVTLLSEHCSRTVFCVHRLDTATAGIMVYAKDPKTAGRLTASLAEDETVKEYICAVRADDPGTGTMEDLIFHDKAKNKTYVVNRERKGVKKARLSYETLSSIDGISVVKVRLFTGRTHQIRVQFASRKMPLVGDGKYGSRDNSPLALRCIRLAFRHPVTDKRLDFYDMPEDPFGIFEK